jgi:hypothetical protein
VRIFLKSKGLDKKTVVLLKTSLTAWLRLTAEGVGQHFEGGFGQQLTGLA